MKIITRKGKTREENIQRIIVECSDKYGVAMLAYFKNSLGGRNASALAVKDESQVQLFHNRISKTYTLQILKFSIAKESILKNYANFKEKYDILIKDEISHI